MSLSDPDILDDLTLALMGQEALTGYIMKLRAVLGYAHAGQPRKRLQEAFMVACRYCVHTSPLRSARCQVCEQLLAIAVESS